MKSVSFFSEEARHAHASVRRTYAVTIGLKAREEAVSIVEIPRYARRAAGRSPGLLEGPQVERMDGNQCDSWPVWKEHWHRFDLTVVGEQRGAVS